MTGMFIWTVGDLVSAILAGVVLLSLGALWVSIRVVDWRYAQKRRKGL